MDIKINEMALDDFLKLQNYIGREENILPDKENDGSRPFLKVAVVDIGGAYGSRRPEMTDIFGNTSPKTITQFYTGISITIVDNSLTKQELEELTTILYKPKEGTYD